MPEPLEILHKLVSYDTSNNPTERVLPDKDILDYINDELLRPLGYESILFEENR